MPSGIPWPKMAHFWRLLEGWSAVPEARAIFLWTLCSIRHRSKPGHGSCRESPNLTVRSRLHRLDRVAESLSSEPYAALRAGGGTLSKCPHLCQKTDLELRHYSKILSMILIAGSSPWSGLIWFRAKRLMIGSRGLGLSWPNWRC